jgi:hypothetical protein
VLKQDKKALFNAMKEANKACEFLSTDHDMTVTVMAN